MTECTAAPDRRHCYHAPYQHPYMGSYPPKEPICCHCGGKQSDGHGPFYQRPASGSVHPYWYVSMNG